jgi:hypothetical protein
MDAALERPKPSIALGTKGHYSMYAAFFLLILAITLLKHRWCAAGPWRHAGIRHVSNLYTCDANAGLLPGDKFR